MENCEICYPGNKSVIAPRRLLWAMAVVLGSGGCGSHAPGEAGAATTSSPSMWIGAVGLGTPDDPNRGIGADVAQFAQGEFIQVRVDASDASPEAQMTVNWFDANGRALAGEARVTRIGHSMMTFDAPGPLPPGRYEVRMRVDGRLAQRRQFEIDAAPGQEAEAAR